MEKRILDIAEKTIRIPKEELMKNCEEIPEIEAFYFWDSARGGLSVIVAKDGTKLGATSAVSFERHVQAFKDGKRN